MLAGAAGLIGGNLFAIGNARASTVTRLTAAPGEHRFLPDQAQASRLLQYNQSTPGPLLRLPQHQTTDIRFTNNLDEASSVHWHGLRIDNAMDGVADLTQPPVMPGESFLYRLTPPDAGTYWYHTHMRSWVQQALGLAGVLIVDEAEPPQVDHDLVCALDDWRLDDDLQFDRASLGALHDWAHEGRTGNVFTVNGKVLETYRVAAGERVRLRLVNIANSRVMNLLLHEAAASVIAIDGQPVKPYPLEKGGITLGPGGRMDLMIDMTGEPGQASLLEQVHRGYAYEVARFEYAASPKRNELLDTPIALPPNPLNAQNLPSDFKRVPLTMEGGAMGRMAEAEYQGQTMSLRDLARQHSLVWALNGIAGKPEEPLFRVPRGTAISLETKNATRWPHAMHLHGHHVQYDRSPGIWRDTVLFDGQESGAMQFVADNPGKWLIHCHMVEHMAGGMVTWFEVT